MRAKASKLSPKVQSLAFALVLLALSFSLAELHAQENSFTVRMKGFADGVGYGARNKAVENAVQEVVRTVIESVAPSADMRLLRPILHQAQKYVARYDILRHDRLGESTSVEIDAYVLEKPLYHDIATVMLPRLPHAPRVLLLIGEQIGHDKIVAIPDFGAAEMVLKERLEILGLKGLGSTSLDKRYSQKELMEIVSGAVDQGRIFSLENNADVVVIGKAISYRDETHAQGNMARNRAEISLKIFRGHDGKMVEALNASAAVHSVCPVEGGEQAVRDACVKVVGDTAVASVIAMLNAQNPNRVRLSIENPGDKERIDVFLNYLRSLPDIYEIETLFHSPKIARFYVDYEGPMALLADAIAPGNYAGAKLDIVRVILRDMNLRFLE